MVIDDKKNPGKQLYTGPSMDEICFLDMAKEANQFGYFCYRDSEMMTI
jgi:hypothetical protein